MKSRGGAGRSSGALWVGLVFLTLGVLWTLDNVGLIESDEILHWWPAVLIAIGLARLIGFAGPARPVLGAILTGVGGLLLLNNFDILDFGIDELWALGLIFIGGMIVYRSWVGRSTPAGATADASDRLNALAIMASVERKIQSPAFRGGEITAIMGGVEIDFRAAQLDGNEAAIELLVIMAGVDLYVPSDWQVVVDATPVMGAIEDNRKAPAAESRQRLVLRGFVMMAGVEIKDPKG